MMSIMSGFSFTPIISFICSFFILSVLKILMYKTSWKYVLRKLRCTMRTDERMDGENSRS
jgi:hypothetical protein